MGYTHQIEPLFVSEDPFAKVCLTVKVVLSPLDAEHFLDISHAVGVPHAPEKRTVYLMLFIIILFNAVVIPVWMWSVSL